MITHFQTCLYVRANSLASKRGDIIYAIQRVVLNWISGKEGHSYDDECGLPEQIFVKLKEKFYRKLTFVFPKSKSTLKTSCYLEGDCSGKGSVKAWAARYVHDDADPDIARKWITDIGLTRLEGEICVVHIAVSHEKDKYSLNEAQESILPVVSIPRIVTNLIKSRAFDVSLDKKFILPLGGSEYTVSNEYEGNILFDWIDSYLRRYVIVVFNGDAVSKYALMLHEQVKGKVIVIRINENAEMKEYMRRINVDREHQVPFNCFRVFFPAVKGVSLSTRNRIFKLDSAKYAVEQVARSLLSNYVLNSYEGIENIEKIGQLITLSKFRSHKPALLESQQPREGSETEHKDNQIAGLQEDIKVLWAEIDQEAENHKNEIDALKAECDRFEKRAGDLQRALDEAGRNCTTKEQALLEWAQEKFPEDLKGLLEYAQKMMPSRLVVLESAFDSAKEASYKGDLSLAWEMLQGLGTCLYQQKFENGHISEEEFNNNHRCKLTMSEGKLTQKDAELMRLREVIYCGKTLDVTPHLKIGTKGSKLLRLHFQFVEDEKKIIIGYFGNHLDNRTTKTMK